MSCATHRCTARIESSHVFGDAAASTCCSLPLDAGPNENRSWPILAYHRPTSCHVSGDETATCISTSFESAAYGSPLRRGTSAAAHVYTTRPAALSVFFGKLRFRSWSRTASDAGASTMNRERLTVRPVETLQLWKKSPERNGLSSSFE